MTPIRESSHLDWEGKHMCEHNLTKRQQTQQPPVDLRAELEARIYNLAKQGETPASSLEMARLGQELASLPSRNRSSRKRGATMNSAAQALGRLGRGKRKTLSPQERERRAAAMRQMNLERQAAWLQWKQQKNRYQRGTKQ